MRVFSIVSEFIKHVQNAVEKIVMWLYNRTNPMMKGEGKNGNETLWQT